MFVFLSVSIRCLTKGKLKKIQIINISDYFGKDRSCKMAKYTTSFCGLKFLKQFSLFGEKNLLRGRCKKNRKKTNKC